MKQAASAPPRRQRVADKAQGEAKSKAKPESEVDAPVPPAAPRPSTLAVTIATQRSGTKLLGNCLNAGLRMRSFGEVFHESAAAMVSWAGFLQRAPNLWSDLALGKGWNLLDQYTLELSRLASYVHFDVMYNNLHYFAPLWHMSPRGLPMLDYLQSRSVAIVHLVRDPLDTYVSTIMAEYTSTYHVMGSLVSKDSKRFNGDLMELVQRRPFTRFSSDLTRTRDAVREQLRGYPFAMEIDYRDLIGSDGFLQPGTRQSLARLLLNGEDPKWLQVLPSSMDRTPKPKEIQEQLLTLIHQHP
jgi:hypothetical protein